MREIDNKNINNLSFNGIQKASNEISASQQEAPAVSEQKEIRDLANVPEAALGKSQISSDSIENDLKFMGRNPELVQVLNEAVDYYAENHSIEETLNLIEKMHQEFVKK